LVPVPLATEVDGLRRALGDDSLGRIPAHLTLVPPVNVAAARLDEAVDVLEAAAARTTGPLALTLGPAATFAPATPAAYLRVGGDLPELHALRDRVFLEPLARSLTYAFVPHVTIVEEAPPERLAAAVSALGDYRAEIRIDRVHLLREHPGRRWLPIADAAFGAPAVVGRGGLAVELAVTEGLAPEADRFFDAAWSAHAPPGRQFAVTARREGAVVGVAVGDTRGEEAWLERLIVEEAARGQGVGRHLVAAVERLGRERGCTYVQLVVRAGGPAEGFYRSLGWEPAGDLPAWRRGLDFRRLKRHL